LELKISKQARGTQILALTKAAQHRTVCNVLVGMAQAVGAEELVLPCVEPVSIYADRPDIIPHLYSFPQRDDGNVCLRAEGTATCQIIADTIWKHRRDVRVFYIARCWRYERPQLGHHYEFDQFGFEVLNPRKPQEQAEWMQSMAKRMIGEFTDHYELRPSSTPRGLYSYTENGFEISCPQLAARKQVCNGGPYKQGYGFEIIIDRILLL
jgi:histidyl-tRNA synthetase